MLKATEQKIFIDTYPEAECEDLPLFAENRVHQRTSGNPYPNKVVLEAQRKVREKCEYTLIKLENDYLEIGILPALGGKIWYANDKRNGYGFFYKNNVVKPALIGVLGSWTSGGVEFNWPFHHRASTFMPVDHYIEQKDGEITVWLSEHDPINRMKGMVGVCLREGECIFETKMKLDNITPHRHSFLFWENAAVPVDESYEIFFPEDVNHVHFHYKRSVTTFPIANNDRFGAFNGIYYDGDTDISKHNSTRQATSYFSASSKYDYFGGYNKNKSAGVVHVADHHISPGKKMFTWAYSQLAKTWENALTDNDGQYAELMAGCYSDNQPDLTWIMPYETKTFSQKWFPIHDAGIPSFANDNGALFISGSGELSLQSVKTYSGAVLKVSDGESTVFERTLDIPTYELVFLGKIEPKIGVRIEIIANGRRIFFYEINAKEEREIPAPRKEYPNYKEIKTAEELYRLGTHVEQYRSPEYSAEQCYLEALERDSTYAPAMVALAELCLKKLDYEAALSYASSAERILSAFNARHESGRAYYLKGLSLLGIGRIDDGYDYLYKSAWCYDYKSAAMLHLGLIDIRRCDYKKAIEHLSESLVTNSKSVVSGAMLAYAYHLDESDAECKEILFRAISSDRLNLYAYAIKAIISDNFEEFIGLIDSDVSEVIMDLAEVFAEAGLYKELARITEAVSKNRVLAFMPMLMLSQLTGGKFAPCKVGIAFPSRSFERRLLEARLDANPDDNDTRYLYATLLYGKGQHSRGAEQYKKIVGKVDDYKSLRALACALYTHENDKEAAFTYMEKAAKLAPVSEMQITFETAYLMHKMKLNPDCIIEFIKSRKNDRDDITVELARAYNRKGDYESALNTLINREFVAAEGGEHYIADQYMYAYYLKGKEAYLKGDYKLALESFTEAMTLPQSLGSGLWNEIKKVPYLYFSARCLEKLGRVEEALKIYAGFKKYDFDFFSDMYLYTFVYYLARGLEALGEKEEAIKIAEVRFNAWDKAMREETLGYFGTTPFFIGFIDEPSHARAMHFSYPLAMLSSFLQKGNSGKYRSIYEEDGYTLHIEDFTV